MTTTPARLPDTAASSPRPTTAPGHGGAIPLPVGVASELAKLLGTLADPTRLRILTALEMVCIPVTEIVVATGLRQPTVSHHLRILREGGLVRPERRGQYVYYCLVTDRVRQVLQVLEDLLAEAASAQLPSKGWLS